MQNHAKDGLFYFCLNQKGIHFHIVEQVNRRGRIVVSGKKLKERLDFIEFRQELLFMNDCFSRLMFQDAVTRTQYDELIELFESYLYEVENGGTVSSSKYESRVYEILPNHKYDYHFAESIALELHKDGMYEEVFEALYGDSSKYQSYLKNNKLVR